MSLADPKPSPCPWFAIWRAEKGTFAQLPLMARALFCEVLKLTDDDGYIELGDREPAEAIAYALGADRSDRRMLAKYVPMLLRDGCLVRDSARLYAPNFKRWQPGARRETLTAPRERTDVVANGPRTDRDAATNEPRTNHDVVTMDPRRGHDAATTEPRPCHETDGKGAESLQVDLQSRVEERRVEKSTDRARARDVTGPVRALPLTEHDLHAGWLTRWSKRHGDAEPDGNRYSPQRCPDALEWGELLAKVRRQAELSGKPERRVATAVLDALFADEWAAARQYPPKLMTSRFAKYASAVTSGGVLDELRARLDELQRQRDLAIAEGRHADVRSIEAEQELVRREIRAAKAEGKAA